MHFSVWPDDYISCSVVVQSFGTEDRNFGIFVSILKKDDDRLLWVIVDSIVDSVASG